MEAREVSGSTFFNMYKKAKDRPPIHSLPTQILGLDPGETTGVCSLTIDPNQLDNWAQDQVNTSIIEWGVDQYSRLITPSRTNLVIAESYRIYSWRVKQHTWSSLLTPRLVGSIETLCRLHGVPLIMQSAQTGKAFCTDDRLKEWGLYWPGHPHAMDAARHLCTFLLFGEWNWDGK